LLEALFNPKSVAVFGVSRNEHKVGNRVARNLIQSGYPGDLYLVNPRGGEVLGHPLLQNLDSIPKDIDLALLLVPAEAVPDALVSCGIHGVRAAIIGAAGFGEMDSDGKHLEERCLQIAREFNMRVVGPNCVGYVDTHFPLNASFLPPPEPLPGEIALVSHSGALGKILIDWLGERGLGVSRFLSLGNQMDLTETDVLAAIAQDEHTGVVAMYLEGIKDGKRFVEQAQAISLKKPIVALKAGRFESSRAAVASHTGAMAGSDQAYGAAFRKAGILRAETMLDLIEWSQALAYAPLPEGRAFAILTNAGGPGAIAADALARHDMQLTELSEKTSERLQEMLPTAASVLNPIDILASGSPMDFQHSLQSLLADAGVDGVLVLVAPPVTSETVDAVEALLPIIQHAVKPVLVAVMGEEVGNPAQEILRKAHVAGFAFPERAAAAMAAMVQRREMLAELKARSQGAAASKATHGAVLLEDVQCDPHGFASLPVAMELARDYGITVAQAQVVQSASEAETAAKRVGFPVALKVLSADIQHKSDVDGVAVNLNSAIDVREAISRMRQHLRTMQPQPAIEGFLVQSMVPGGQEVILGAKRDRQFGPLIMFGSGGVEVEGLEDLAFGLSPLDFNEARRMLASTWAGRKLEGYRGLDAGDSDAVIEILMNLDRMMQENPAIEEIELNPVLVCDRGKGAVAVDFRLRLSAG